MEQTFQSGVGFPFFREKMSNPERGITRKIISEPGIPSSDPNRNYLEIFPGFSAMFSNPEKIAIFPTISWLEPGIPVETLIASHSVEQVFLSYNISTSTEVAHDVPQ